MDFYISLLIEKTFPIEYSNGKYNTLAELLTEAVSKDSLSGFVLSSMSLANSFYHYTLALTTPPPFVPQVLPK